MYVPLRKKLKRQLNTHSPLSRQMDTRHFNVLTYGHATLYPQRNDVLLHGTSRPSNARERLIPLVILHGYVNRYLPPAKARIH